MVDPSIYDLTNRLNCLENSNRNLRRGFWGIGLAVIVLVSLGAMQADQAQIPKDISCGTMHANKIVIGGEDGHERLVLELESGEPTLKMFNHEGRRQIFLGIDEYWDDTAYLSVSSRLENGNIDKQAVLAATTKRTDLPSSTQLLLYDGHPQQKKAANRHVVRLSTGSVEHKPFVAIDELSEKGEDGVSLKLLEGVPTSTEHRVFLDTNSKPAILSGVETSRK